MKHLVAYFGSLLLSVACQSGPQGSAPGGKPPSASAASPSPSEAGNSSAAADPNGAKQAAPAQDTRALTASDSKAAALQGASDAPASDAPASDAPSTEETADGVTRGPVVKDEAFSVWLEATSPAAAGKPAEVKAMLVANPPYHCNEEYPHKFKFSAAPKGMTYPKKAARGMKVTPQQGVLTMEVRPQSAGTANLAGKLSFSVCTEERCLVEKRELSLALAVE